MPEDADVLLRQQTRRAVVLLLLVGVVALIVASHAIHDRLDAITIKAATFVEHHSAAGMVVFLVLSTFSAMLAFFSTVALVPIAVTAWGKIPTLLMLWCGWLIGGAISYGIGRYLGRSVVTRFIPEERLRSYESELRKIAGFPHILLLQIALPSEVPGYVLGTLRYDPKTYLAALAIAEFPFAFGAVYLGESFLRGDVVLLIALGFAGIALSWSAATILRHRLRSSP
ncbi:MAG TPA: VTT domain-containing protein [Thermoanaerobaculia bacterium]